MTTNKEHPTMPADDSLDAHRIAELRKALTVATLSLAEMTAERNQLAAMAGVKLTDGAAHNAVAEQQAATLENARTTLLTIHGCLRRTAQHVTAEEVERVLDMLESL